MNTKMNNDLSGLAGLSPRAVNCAWILNLRTRAQVASAVQGRVLHPSNVQASGLGAKTYNEIREWLGLPIPLSAQQACTIRAGLALQLREQLLSFQDISTVLRLGSKEKARILVARGRSARKIWDRKMGGEQA